MAITPKLYLNLLLLLCTLLAQGQKLFFEQLTTAEGLPSDYVNQVFEDSKGYLWIATDKGVCRYDGREFQLFNKDNGLPENFVMCIAEDNKGQVWVGTYQGHLCKFDQNKIVSVNVNSSPNPKPISQIHFNPDNSLLVATTEPQVYFLENELAKPKLVVPNLSYFTPIDSNTFLTAIKHDLYFLHRTESGFSLEHLKKHGDDTYILKPWLNKVNFLGLKNNRISHYRLENKKLTVWRDLQLKADWTEIKDYEVRNDEILIATNQGLFYIDEKNRQHLMRADNGLGSDYINRLYRDSRNNVYVCTLGGGIKIWRGLYLQEHDIRGKVTSILPSKEKVYFTSTQNNYQYSLSKGELIQLHQAQTGNFTSIFKLPNGGFYLGTLVNYYHFPNESILMNFSEINKSKYLRHAHQGVSGFATKHNRTYVSTYGDGIIVLDNNQHRTDTLRFGSGIIESLVPLTNSIAALSFSFGITLIDSSHRIKTISSSDGLLSNTVYCLFEENENNLWIGSLHGVNHYNANSKINRFSYEQGFLGNRAVCIFRDQGQRLWVLSDKFLHLVEGGKLRPIQSHPVLLDKGNSINRATYYRTTNQLFIGVTDGILIVNMGAVKTESIIAKPRLPILIADSVAMTAHQQEYSIKANTKRISFRFLDPTRNFSFHQSISYKLEPFDEEWQVLDNTLEAAYQKIPAGNYRLLWKTTNPDGLDSPVYQFAKIKILPPFWKQPWFIIVFIVIAIATFYLTGHHISKARYKQRLRNLEANYRLQLERERIARELHDNVGSQLTYLINTIDDNHETLSEGEEASKLSNFARTAMQELRDTIWALDKKDLLVEELENKIRQLVRLYKDKKSPVKLEWTTERPGTWINPLKALNIYRIVQEALNNADKYSKAPEIIVKAEQLDSRIELSILDNGNGFELEKVTEGYGLKNMKKRAEEMHGEIEILTEPHKGTMIRLHVPSLHSN